MLKPKIALVRSAIPLMLAVFLVVFGSTMALAANWSRVDRAPSIRLLGSGNELSLIVTSRHARFLIATGSDASAFGNAVANALHPTNRRVDIMVLAGDANDLPVARRAKRDFPMAAAWVIAGPLAAQREAIGIGSDHVIATPVRFQLAEDFTITLMPDPGFNGGWLAQIAFGHTVIFAGANSMISTVTTRAGAIVVADGRLPQMSSPVFPAILGLSVSAGSNAKLAELAAASQSGFYAVRVGRGEAITIRLKTDSLVLPRNTRRFDPVETS